MLFTKFFFPLYHAGPVGGIKSNQQIQIKKLHISLIFSNLVTVNPLSLNHRMCNLYTKFVKILGICKQFSQNLVNECGNIPRRGPVPKFSDLEVVALSLTAEAESIDSEKWLFDYKLQEHKSKIPNLISRRQFNDRRKKTAGLCEEIRKRIAMESGRGRRTILCRLQAKRGCVGWQEGHVARWDGLGTFHKFQTSVTALHKTHIISDINSMLSVD